MLCLSHMPAKSLGTTHQDEETDPSTKGSNAELTGHQDGCKEEKEEGGEEDDYEGGHGVYEEEETCEETPEDEEVKVEWPTGVTQASDKDLAKLSSTEGVGTHRVSAALSHVCLMSPLIFTTREGETISDFSI